MVDFGIREMHYYFDEQLKIADNMMYQELSIPQKDFLFNVAEETYVKMIAFPLYNPLPKFEISDRTINNIHALVVNASVPKQVTKYDETSYLFSDLSDVRYFLGGSVIANNGLCYKEIDLFPVMHSMITTKDYTIKSSFLWEEVNYRMIDKGVLIEADFTITGIKPHYIKRTKYMHNAQDYTKGNGTYKKLDGTILTGVQNSELSKNALLDVVHIAVLLLKTDIGVPIEGSLAKIREVN